MSADKVTFGEAQELAVRLANGEVRWDADRVGSPGDSVVPIFACAPEFAGAFLLGQELDSSAHVVLPTLDLDSEDTVAFDLYFCTGVVPFLLVVATDPAPRDLVECLLLDIADDLPEHDDDGGGIQRFDFASGCEWLLIYAARRRIRDVEQSVRAALADDAVSERDYSALRAYPNRLAAVERLWADTPDPTWESHGPRGQFDVPRISTPIIANPGEEAREAGARLSGLISSQAVVVAQRQAADTERFQRLVTVVGAAVLVPGLVAAVFGANVGFRGEGTSRDFWAMLLVMAGSALGSYAVLRSRELGVWADLSRARVINKLRIESARGRLALVGCLALIGVLAGVSVLLSGSGHV